MRDYHSSVACVGCLYIFVVRVCRNQDPGLILNGKDIKWDGTESSGPKLVLPIASYYIFGESQVPGQGLILLASTYLW